MVHEQLKISCQNLIERELKMNIHMIRYRTYAFEEKMKEPRKYQTRGSIILTNDIEQTTPRTKQRNVCGQLVIPSAVAYRNAI